MSKKNLSRTVIEGGRTGRNKWERRYSHKETRANENNFLADVKGDVENYYEYDIQETKKVYKQFDDKLGPIFRWLESKLGEPWNEVRSEISQKFDVRTTAGRHIINDHLLGSVEETPSVYRRYYQTENPDYSHYKHDYFVDATGILCRRKYIPRRHKHISFDTNRIVNWLSSRVVGQVGNKFFWFVPADKNKKRGGNNRQWKVQWGGPNNYYSNYNSLNFLYLRKVPIYKYEKGILVYENEKPIIVSYKTSWEFGSPNFRQDRKLNDKELSFWNSLPKYYQTKVLEHSPTYIEPKSNQFDLYYNLY